MMGGGGSGYGGYGGGGSSFNKRNNNNNNNSGGGSGTRFGGYNSNSGSNNYSGGGGFSNNNSSHFGGGGFMQSSPGGGGGGGGGGFTTPGGGGETPKGPGGNRRGDQSLRPVTIKNLQRARQDGADMNPFNLDGRELATAVVIGRVTRTLSQSTFNVYTIHDGTAQMDVKKWIDKDASVDEFSEDSNEMFPEGSYVKAIGTLRMKMKSTDLELHAFSVRPVESMDEITYHFLDCIYVHLYLTRPMLDTSAQHMGGGHQQQQQQQFHLNQEQSDAFQKSAYNNNNNNNGYQFNNTLQERICNLVRGNECTIGTIIHNMRAYASEQEIRGMVGHLETEGYLCNTNPDMGEMTT
ncbi:replication factor A protein 2, partial [Blyttiomyces sp. JEL0837]